MVQYRRSQDWPFGEASEAVAFGPHADAGRKNMSKFLFRIYTVFNSV